MAPGLPDRVDCAYLADHAVVLDRVYPLGAMPRLRDLLADARGSVRANFAFAKAASGRPGATVVVEATPHLRCQRCLEGFEFAVAGRSEVEFTSGSNEVADSDRETFATVDGLVSLRELAEEELLLALPIVAMHEPRFCERAPTEEAGDEVEEESVERSWPFAALQDLLKKT
jgi:uncharacterized protein